LGVPADRLFVLGSGVDLDRMTCRFSKGEARVMLGLPAALPIVSYTGHLYPAKGVDTLVRALPSLTDVHAVIAGGMPDDVSRTRRLAEALGVTNVTLTGHLPPDRIPLFLKASDAVVLPYSAASRHSSRYTSPMKLFEYMAMKLPIVASDLPSVREVLTDGHDALLIPPDDPSALASSIRRVLGDRELAERLGVMAYQEAQKRTWIERARRILSLGVDDAMTTLSSDGRDR
jgi:glycosyltransferase involved in cell wall biosynthesis